MIVTTSNGKKQMLPRASYRRRVLRDLIRCGVGTRGRRGLNPSRGLCDEAAWVIVTLEASLLEARKARRDR